MPTVTIDLMTDEEKERFSRAATDVLLANADGYCGMQVETDPDGTYRLKTTNHARGERARELEEAFSVLRNALQEGKASVVQRDGRSWIDPTITRTHHYPMAHMTPQEEVEFEDAFQRVIEAVGTKQCRFESDLDGWARIYFRYQLLDEAQDRGGILNAIDLVIRQVHAGKAVRVEMPGRGVLLMPRWPEAGKHEEEQPCCRPNS